MTEVQPVENQGGNSAMKKGLVGILSIGALVAIGAYLNSKSKNTVSTQPSVANSPQTNPTGADVLQTGTATEATATVYKNGVYAAKGSYASPAGGETIDVMLTIVGDKVTNATFKGNATNPASVNWQGKFSQGFNEAVVGKSIDTLSLTVVNGASLTPKGFMDALTKIKTQAKG